MKPQRPTRDRLKALWNRPAAHPSEILPVTAGLPPFHDGLMLPARELMVQVTLRRDLLRAANREALLAQLASIDEVVSKREAEAAAEPQRLELLRVANREALIDRLEQTA